MHSSLLRRLRGQAMVEFVVLCMFVLGVLFLSVAALARFSDVRNKVLSASRYAAWERTVWLGASARAGDDDAWYGEHGASALAVSKTDAVLRGEIATRIAAGRDAVVRSGSTHVATLPAMWIDAGGKAFTQGVASIVVNSASASIDDDALTKKTDPGRSFGQVGDAQGRTVRASMSLPSRTQQSATVSIEVGRLSSALRKLWPTFDTLTFADGTTLLGNPWVPEGLAGSRSVFADAVPAAKAELLNPAGYRALARYAPEIETLDLGRIAPHVLPLDRRAQP